MAKKRTYLETYIQYGFTCQKKDDVDLPQCVICYKVLGNDSLKPAKLKLHLSKCHSTLVQKDKSFFGLHLSSFKRQRLDSFGTYHERTTNAVRASYIVAYKVAQAKKPHTIVEQLLLPCAKEMVRLVVGEDAALKLDDISVSNDTVSRRINEISLNIKEQVVDEIKNLLFLPYSWTNQLMSHNFLSYWHLCDMYMREISRRNFYFASLLNSILELRMC